MPQFLSKFGVLSRQGGNSFPSLFSPFLDLVATRVFVNPLLNARVRLYARLLLFPKIFYFAKSFREPCFPFQNSSYPPSPLFFKGGLWFHACLFGEGGTTESLGGQPIAFQVTQSCHFERSGSVVEKSRCLALSWC